MWTHWGTAWHEQRGLRPPANFSISITGWLKARQSVAQTDTFQTRQECQIISPLTTSPLFLFEKKKKKLKSFQLPQTTRCNHSFVPSVHNLLYEAGPAENAALSSNYQVQHMIQYLVYESKYFTFRGMLLWRLERCWWCVPSLSGGLGKRGGGGMRLLLPPKPGVLRINAANQKGMWR